MTALVQRAEAGLARPDQAVREAMVTLLGAGVPEATRRAYAVDRQEWATFVTELGRPVLPPDADDLAEYVAYLLTVGSPVSTAPRPLKATTVERRLSAVSTWAVEQGWGRPNLRPAKVILRGHRRTRDSSTRQVAPVTVGVLRALVGQAMQGGGDAQGLSARAARDRAMVLLGFAIAARRSELVALDLASVLERPEGMIVSVRRAKTSDRSQHVHVPWATADTDLCPVRAVGALRRLYAERGITEGPLFRRVTRTDALLPHRLTPQSVRLVVDRLAQAACVAVPEGFAPYAAHSLRRGLATEARRAGHDALAIARQGGWVDGSAALSRYLSDVDGWESNALGGVL